MRNLYLFGWLTLLICTGCRQEDWRVVEIDVHHPMTLEQAQRQIQFLDSQTPPKVLSVRSNTLKIRYNSMNIAKRNLEVALEPK